MSDPHCIFEYMYRDAGNWKTFGSMLLRGEPDGMKSKLLDCFEPGGLFVAEQAGVPVLCERHWQDCGEGPSELDHAFHEFVDLRPANDAEIAALPLTDTLLAVLSRMQACAGRWDVLRSPNAVL